MHDDAYTPTGEELRPELVMRLTMEYAALQSGYDMGYNQTEEECVNTVTTL